jgi:hypothetical protein
VLMLVGDDCCFVAEAGRGALLAHCRVARGDCEGLCELKSSGAEYYGAAVEYASEY